MTKKIGSSQEESGQTKTPDSPKEAVILETGEYSRVMKADEYREWVRQTVAGQIWGRLIAILSGFGVATIIGVLSYVTTTSSTTVNTALKAEVSTLRDRLDSQIKDITTKDLPRIVGNELDRQVRAHELEKKITESAVAEITKNKGVETALQHLIINQSQEILTNRAAPQSSLRAVALQQILLFGNKEQKIEAIRSVILDENSGDHEFELALQNYPSNRSDAGLDQRRQLYTILERAVRRTSGLSTESWRALEQVLTQDGEVKEASAWITNAAVPMGEKYSIESLRRVTERIAKAGGLAAAKQFIAWLESDEHELKMLGQHGLASMDPPEDATARRALVAQIIHALAIKGLETSAFTAHLTETVSAIRRRNKAELRRIGDSDFTTQPVKKLIADLIKEPEDRSKWNVALRTITTVQELEVYGGYGEYERALSAYRLVGKFLDIDPHSNDWQKVVLPKIAEAGGTWTAPSEANLLVNAWVLRLQAAGTAMDAVADLFISAHANGDRNLLLYNTHSYRTIISRPGDAIITKVLEKAPSMVGTAERRKQENDDLDKSETAILNDIILRLLSDVSRNVERVNSIRAAFEKVMNDSVAQRSHAIWFAAVAQHAGMDDVSPQSIDPYKILTELVDQTQKRGKAVTATVLLAIVTNKCFLQLPNVRAAVERANLHLFESDVSRSKPESFVNEIAKVITADVRKALGWFDNLDRLAGQIRSTPMRLPSEQTWLSFEVSDNKIPQFVIHPANELTYTLVDSSQRVVDTQTWRVPNGAEERLIFNVRATQPGRYFLRVSVPSVPTATRAALNFQLPYAVYDLPSAQKGNLHNVSPGESIIVKTGGDDDGWVGLNAKAGKTYIMLTHSLWSDEDDGIDTVIEVYDPTESRKLKDDDDGGEEAGGERFSSLLSISSDADIVYHIKLKNINSASGTFAFEVAEQR